MKTRLEAHLLAWLSLAAAVVALGASSAARRNLPDTPVENEPTTRLPDRMCQGVPQTGQVECWDQDGNPVACSGTGEDGEYQSGFTVDPWPRFTDRGNGTVEDNLTGLVWLKSAGCLGGKDWAEALSDANGLASGSCGLTDGSRAGDWRLPNVKELESLIDFSHFDPALSTGHPFEGVQSNHYYWSSTSHTSPPDQAWLVEPTSGIVQVGAKGLEAQVWPVRARSLSLSQPGHHGRHARGGHRAAARLPDRKCQGVPASGQTDCWDEHGMPVDCAGTGQDGDGRAGFVVDPWPRFTDDGDGTVKDNLTGLVWLENADCFGARPWAEALSDANTLASGACGLTDGSVAGDWRLPNIKELESLVDFNRSFPALSTGHPFDGVVADSDVYYWSSTTFTEHYPDVAWTLEFARGRAYVAVKTWPPVHVWPVRSTR
jgi:uncharacterized membrane protein